MMERAHEPELKIAERYFLGELTDDDAEAFEAHYFECARCAEYVVEELTMLESGREVARSVPPVQQPKVVPLPFRRRAATWLSAAAAAVIVMLAGTPMLMRAPMPRVDMIEPIHIQFSADRGTAAAHAASGPAIPLVVDIPPTDWPEIEVTVRNQAGEIVHQRHTIPAQQPKVSLVLSALPAGTYNVVIEGVREKGNRAPIASESFEVRGEPSKEGEP